MTTSPISVIAASLLAIVTIYVITNIILSRRKAQHARPDDDDDDDDPSRALLADKVPNKKANDYLTTSSSSSSSSSKASSSTFASGGPVLDRRKSLLGRRAGSDGALRATAVNAALKHKRERSTGPFVGGPKVDPDARTHTRHASNLSIEEQRAQRARELKANWNRNTVSSLSRPHTPSNSTGIRSEFQSAQVTPSWDTFFFSDHTENAFNDDEDLASDEEWAQYIGLLPALPVRRDGHSVLPSDGSATVVISPDGAVAHRQHRHRASRDYSEYHRVIHGATPEEEEEAALEASPEGPGKHYRRLAVAEAKLRKQCFERSKRAFKSGRKSDAKTLSDEGKMHDEAYKEYNRRAAEEIFWHSNPRYGMISVSASSGTPSPPYSRCDLHNLHVEEAKYYVHQHVERCIQAGVERTMLITGAGNHSSGGQSRLKPAILMMLEQYGMARQVRQLLPGGLVSVPILRAGMHERNPGCIVVEFARPM